MDNVQDTLHKLLETVLAALERKAVPVAWLMEADRAGKQFIDDVPASEQPRAWYEGHPPRRGVYLTKSDGPSANRGYRYWYGDGWSNLRHSRKDAVELGKDRAQNRNTPLKNPVLWASALGVTK